MIVETSIALAALVLTLYGIHATNRHNRLSVRPYLVGSQNRTNGSDSVSIGYGLCNHGIGPARILGLKLFLDGEPFAAPKGDGPIEALLQARVGGRVPFAIRWHSWPGVGYIIPAGQVSHLMEIVFPGVLPVDRGRLEDVLDGLNLRVDYESFYGERFHFDTRE